MTERGRCNKGHAQEGRSAGRDAGVDLPPEEGTRGRAEEQRAARLQQLALVWELLSAAATALYVGLCVRTQSWQMFAALGLSFSAAMLCRASRRLSRRGRERTGGALLLVVSLTVPVLATSFISGAALLSAGLVLVLAVGIVALSWPRYWLSWGLLPGSLGALVCMLLDRVAPWARLSAGGTPALTLPGAGLAAVGLASLLWLLAEEPPGSVLRTRLLVSFVLVGTPPAAAASVTAVLWRWLQSHGAATLLDQGTVEALGAPMATWLLGGGAALGSAVFSLALAFRLARRIAEPFDALVARLRENAPAEPVSSQAGLAQLAELSKALSSMEVRRRTALREMEERLSRRTEELERRCRYGEVLAEVSRVSLSLADVQRLGRAVVDIVRDGLSLRYVGLYTLNSGQRWAELRAETEPDGSGSPGWGRRIPIGEGLVGRAAEEAQAIVRAGPAEMPYTGFREAAQDTATQVALPMQSRGRVLGVLVAHAGPPEGLSDERIDVLQSMAGHVALALDNAHLLEEGQAALDAARRASGTLSLGAWQDVLRARTDLGFRSGEQGVERADQVWFPRMARAEQANATVLVRGEDADRAGESLTVPVRIHGEVIGVLDTYKPDGEGVWTAEQVGLVEQIAEELSQALENARLYEETQRRGMRERQLREIATRIGAGVNLDTILQAAVEDVAKALGVPSAFVQLYGQRAHTDKSLVE